MKRINELMHQDCLVHLLSDYGVEANFAGYKPQQIVDGEASFVNLGDTEVTVIGYFITHKEEVVARSIFEEPKILEVFEPLDPAKLSINIKYHYTGPIDG